MTENSLIIMPSLRGKGSEKEEKTIYLSQVIPITVKFITYEAILKGLVLLNLSLFPRHKVSLLSTGSIKCLIAHTALAPGI